MIVAEIGQNHCGDMDLARFLIWEAQDKGADLVKFQLYDHKMLYGDNPDILNVGLSFDQAEMLFDYGKEIGIEVFFSVFDTERIKWCEEIGVKRYKLACGWGMKTDLIQAIDLTEKPIFISDNPGMLMRILPNRSKVTWFYCIPEYPALPDRLMLGRINFEYNADDKQYRGFSDHSIGLDAAKIALARGASIIEKHFALDHSTGIDAPWSMTPDELEELIRFAQSIKGIL